MDRAEVVELGRAGVRRIEGTFVSHDGTDLFYRGWLPEGFDKAVLLFHRGHEHSGRWEETVERMGFKDAAVFAWDARGHGRSAGERGSAKHLGVLVQDVEEWVRHLKGEYGLREEQLVVVAHSVGAVIATAWVHDYAPRIAGLVLATPAFEVKLYVPFAIPLLRLRERLFGPGYVKSYVKPEMLTHDATEAKAYAADKLIFREIAVNVLLDLHDTSKRLVKDAGAIRCPTMILAAGADWVVKNEVQRRFFESISSEVKRFEVLRGFHHAIFHEKERALVLTKVRGFIDECFRHTEGSQRREALLHADQSGYTRAEFDALCQPTLNPSFALTRLGMKTVGQLSAGIRLGWESGFDSGKTLDYVYENRPRGRTALGRMIDRAYLESIGWRGIRVRKEHLQATLRAALQRVRSEGRAVRVLDIASGPGRYVLETVKELPGLGASVLLRDYKRENVKAAQALATDLQVPNVRVGIGNAFDGASIAAVTPKVSVGIVSGLYELFPENAPVMESLKGLARAIEPGGFLIYTNQPWHPQMEFIARVLRNREGAPWIMRRRTQAEMDQLVRAAGFRKIEQKVDRWGIFTVSLAQRVEDAAGGEQVSS
ncbi:MAG: bifunctional alpha/beta hydrolase/class I SAM-dependent methyltransferase [Limisphaerales bacterium]